MENSRRKEKQNPFETTSPARRQRIFEAAIHEFATKGFNAANINIIARAAGVSIGSMYSYFASKEDLFLQVMEYCLQRMYQLLSKVNREQGVVETFREMLSIARDAARQYPEMNQSYLDCSSQSLVSLSEQLSRDAEAVTVELYAQILTEDQEKGRVREDLDIAAAAFMLDNLVMMYQFSFVSNYYMERKKLFLGGMLSDDEEEVIDAMVDFVRRAVE